MRLPLKERSVSTWVVVPSAIIVAVLAVMQYRWSTGVSEATAVRLADSLQMSLVNWQIDFYRYFADLTQAMRVNSGDISGKDASVVDGRMLASWRSVSKYPELVKNVLVTHRNAPDYNFTMERLDPESLELHPAAWDEKFAALRSLYTLARGLESGEWWFEPSVPALIQVQQREELLVLELDRTVIRRIFEDLSHTYFQGTNGLDYLVAVIAPQEPQRVLYSSDKGFGDPEPEDADGVISLFARPHAKSEHSPVQVFHAPSTDQGPTASMRISWFPLVPGLGAYTGDWKLVVRHRRGGALGAFVAEMRRRDLAIGFGVLLVLVVNMGMLIVTSHRAQRLAQLQMNFVTAVSHELRTPLTVIMSGADNISNGVVENNTQMKQYGSLIGKQARQLFGLVERILLFASTRQGQQRYQMRPLQVGEVIDTALAATKELVEAGQFQVELNVPSNLPQVMGDASLLSQCLQNLITNALKYGKDRRWLKVEAESNAQEVRIHVADRGIGISPADLPHIFEPFYRSPSVRAAQIGGTGLGLPLSQSIAEGMNGRVTVESTLGQGSTFTVHLPAIEAGSAAA